MRTSKSIVAIVAIILGMSIQVKAQETDTLGIHVSGGYSSAEAASSNIGRNNRATGNNSFAAGWWCNATGMTSFALGYGSTASNINTMALGMYTKSQSAYSITIGRGYSESKPLLNDKDGIMFGYGSNLPTLFITGQNTDNRTGKVGIGDMTNPQAKLHILGDTYEDVGIILESKQPEHRSAFIQFKDENHKLSVNPNGAMTLTAGTKPLNLEGSKITLTGKVGINTTNTVAGYAFAVDGGIITDEVLIRDVEDWPDYVFGNSHRLMPLGELQTYVKQNSHLPEIPSAQEVEENGVNVGEMQQLLLKKIEELTLYTIEQQRLIENLQERINQLENQ